MLIMKKILALVMVAALALAMVACGGNEKVTLKILDTEYTVEDYAICVAKENTELLDAINKALAELLPEEVGEGRTNLDYNLLDGQGKDMITNLNSEIIAYLTFLFIILFVSCPVFKSIYLT